MPLAAPSPAGWMPPPSSFHALAFGSSLPMAGSSPGDAAKAAAAAASDVATTAIVAVRAYDSAAVAPAVSGVVPSPTVWRADSPAVDPLADARQLLAGTPGHAREASIRRQTSVLIGLSVCLGALMAVLVLLGSFDAGVEASGGWALGIVLAAIAQAVLLVWAVVLVMRSRLAGLPRTSGGPGRAIWITLVLSPLPLFFLRGVFGAMG
jgi:hypothetical protein